MIFEKILAISFSLLILAQAYIVRRLVGTWIFPACLFGLFWFLYTFVPLVALFSVPVEPLAVGFIFLCCFVFSISAFFFNWRAAFEINRHRVLQSNYASWFIRAAFYVCTFLALLFLLINTLMQGIPLYDIVFNIMETAKNYIARRYNDDLNVNVFGQLSVILTYLSAILGGLFYGVSASGRGRMETVVMSLAPSILVMLIQGAKGTLFLAITYFWSGILLYKIGKNDFVLFRKKSVAQLLIYAALIFPALVMSFLVRGLYDADDFDYIKQGLIKNFSSYTSAHLYSFSDWFSHLIFGRSVMSYTDDFGSHGFYTFMSLFKALGSEKYVPPGYYDEYFYYGDILQTNIYTMFRGLIYDFGLIGAMDFMLLFGLICHFGFCRLLTERRPIVAASIFVHSLGFFYTSFLISMLVWNSPFISFALLIVILYINDLMTGESQIVGIEHKALSLR